MLGSATPNQVSVKADLGREIPVAFISNALDPPPDEGIKKCAREIASVLSELGLTVVAIPAGGSFFPHRLLLAPRAVGRLRAIEASVLLYLPAQSASTATFVRIMMLRVITRSEVVLLSLQPSPLTGVKRWLARHFGPKVLLTPSPTLLRDAVREGLSAEFIPLGTDPSAFRPVGQAAKHQLRRAHGLPVDARIVLHVGHARRLRSLDWLTGLEASDGVRALVVLGKSLGADPEVLGWLRESGVRVIQGYVPKIHEIYQLADVYAFPVTNEASAVAVPLSVLEAMACNLPVVTTRFGGLPEMLTEGDGLFFAGEKDKFRAAISQALLCEPDEVKTREQAIRYSWPATVGLILGNALER